MWPFHNFPFSTLWNFHLLPRTQHVLPPASAMRKRQSLLFPSPVSAHNNTHDWSICICFLLNVAVNSSYAQQILPDYLFLCWFVFRKYPLTMHTSAVKKKKKPWLVTASQKHYTAIFVSTKRQAWKQTAITSIKSWSHSRCSMGSVIVIISTFQPVQVVNSERECHPLYLAVSLAFISPLRSSTPTQMWKNSLILLFMVCCLR